MSTCQACQRDIPLDAKFCGYCGFRLIPISPDDHRRLSAQLAPITREDEFILLTKPKRSSGPHPTDQPRLEIISTPAASAKATPLTPLVPQDFKAPPPRSQHALVKPAPLISRKESIPPSEELQNPCLQLDRRLGRHPLVVEVSYSSEHNFYTGFSENISGGGLFIATRSPAPLGTVLEVTFTVPGLDEPCTAICRVRWVREDDGHSPDLVPGMGLQFAQLDSRARAAVELFLKHRDAIFFDDE
jgi:uncharacterized protein (TIGR02266 family)